VKQTIPGKRIDDCYRIETGTTIVRIDFVATHGGNTQATLASLVFDELDTVYLVIATCRFMLKRGCREARHDSRRRAAGR
jgi:hypothetical protein